MTVRITAAAAILVAVSAGQAQEKPQPRDIHSLLELTRAPAQPTVVRAEELPGVAEPPDPPTGAGAWSLRVDTSGGFTGRGVGSVTISSDGQMACGPAPCATPVALPMLKSVADVIPSVLEAVWIRQTPSGLCRDCILTTIALKRRDGDVVRTYRAGWDDSQSVAPELRELRRLALELRATRSAQR